MPFVCLSVSLFVCSITQQEGWLSPTERASVSAISLRHIPPWVRPWDNRGKCHMYGKRIQCWSNASQHVPIYLQPFTSYSETLVALQLFPTLILAFNAPVGSVLIRIPGKVWSSEN